MLRFFGSTISKNVSPAASGLIASITSVYSLHDVDIDGNVVKFDEDRFKNKVLVFVNVASK